MFLISHRGNISGANIEYENKPQYIEHAIACGFDVEIDVWYIKDFFLGHDIPQYKINASFLENNKLWCHAKNIEALERMGKNKKIHYFWHDRDDFTITSNGFIWSNINKLCSSCIVNQPDKSIIINNELVKTHIINKTIKGVCSDVIENYRYHVN